MGYSILQVVPEILTSAPHNLREPWWKHHTDKSSRNADKWWVPYVIPNLALERRIGSSGGTLPVVAEPVALAVLANSIHYVREHWGMDLLSQSVNRELYGHHLTYLWKGALVAPQVGCSKLLQSPSSRRYLPARHSTWENTGGQTSRIKVRDVSIKGSPFSISSYVKPYLENRKDCIILFSFLRKGERKIFFFKSVFVTMSFNSSRIIKIIVHPHWQQEKWKL